MNIPIRHRINLAVLALFAMTFTVAPLVRSTTIVAVSSGDQIFIGADSLTDISNATSRGHMCKITVCGSYAAAFAGLLGDIATEFDVRSLVSAALATPGDLSAKSKEFENRAREPLRRSLEYGRRHEPETFSKRFLGKKVLQVVFAEVDKGKPSLIVLTFRVTETGELTVDKPKVVGQGQAYIFGENDAIARYQTSEPNWAQADPATIVRTFLGLEIADKPSLVGAPISILNISPVGVRWVAAGACSSGTVPNKASEP